MRQKTFAEVHTGGVVGSGVDLGFRLRTTVAWKQVRLDLELFKEHRA